MNTETTATHVGVEEAVEQAPTTKPRKKRAAVRNVRTDTMQRFLQKVAEAGRKDTLIGQLLLLSARAEITGRMLYQRMDITSVSFRRAVETGKFEREFHRKTAEHMVDTLAAALNAGVLPVRIAEVQSVLDVVERVSTLQSDLVRTRRQLETVRAGLALRQDPDTSSAAINSHLATLEDSVDMVGSEGAMSEGFDENEQDGIVDPQ